MKRKEFLKELRKLGVKFIRHGNKHDIYGRGSKTTRVPRHSEINEELARSIIKEFS